MVSTNGESPPCTQNTAPDSVFDPCEELEAPVPGGPDFEGGVGEFVMGEDESNFSPCDSVYLCRGIRLTKVPFSFTISISISDWSSGSEILTSARGVSSKSNCVVAPVTSAPNAK